MVRKTGKEVCKMAFDYLLSEGKKDSALKIAKVLLNDRDVKLSLGLNDIDWDIQTAIERCGAEVKSNWNGNIAFFNLEYYHILDEKKFNEMYDMLYSED